MPHKSTLIGASPWTRRMLSDINLFAPGSLPILIVGETGTGKDVIANAIHAASRRGTGNFLAVNCATLENLADSELFGHHKGAFTGAVQDTLGFIGCAAGGTLFLDEVADLPKPTQVKLLRFLDTGEFYPVGAATPRKADVRIVCATNVNLEEAIRQGRFREDLYFRLSGITLATAPLRDRREDIAPLARHFLAMAHGAPVDLPDACARSLERYSWPGNVRQLRTVLLRVDIRRNGRALVPADIEAELPPEPGCATLGPYREAKEKLLREFDGNYFQHLQAASQGSLARALAIAGMHKKNYYAKLKELGLIRREVRAPGQDAPGPTSDALV